MESGDPWSWGVDDSSATTPDSASDNNSQWNNTWSTETVPPLTSNNQHHNLSVANQHLNHHPIPPLSSTLQQKQNYPRGFFHSWSTNSSEPNNVIRPPMPVTTAHPAGGTTSQLGYNNNNNNVAMTTAAATGSLSTFPIDQVENREIAPPDHVNLATSESIQDTFPVSQPFPPPPASGYFNQQSQPMMQPHYQQQQTVNQSQVIQKPMTNYQNSNRSAIPTPDSFFNQFSKSSATAHLNQQFQQSLPPPSLSSIGTGNNNSVSVSKPESEKDFFKQFAQPIENYQQTHHRNTNQDASVTHNWDAPRQELEQLSQRSYNPDGQVGHAGEVGAGVPKESELPHSNYHIRLENKMESGASISEGVQDTLDRHSRQEKYDPLRNLNHPHESGFIRQKNNERTTSGNIEEESCMRDNENVNEKDWDNARDVEPTDDNKSKDPQRPMENNENTARSTLAIKHHEEGDGAPRSSEEKQMLPDHQDPSVMRRSKRSESPLSGASNSSHQPKFASVGSSFHKYEKKIPPTDREVNVSPLSPVISSNIVRSAAVGGANEEEVRGTAAGHSSSPPNRLISNPLPDNQETLPDMSSLSLDIKRVGEDDVYSLDRNQYLEMSQLSSQIHGHQRLYTGSHIPSGSGGEREIDGDEGEDSGGGRVVVGEGRKQPTHSTPVHGTSSPLLLKHHHHRGGGPSSSSSTNLNPQQSSTSVAPVPHESDDRRNVIGKRRDRSPTGDSGGSRGGDSRHNRSSRMNTSYQHHHHHRSSGNNGGRSMRQQHRHHRPPSSHRESSFDDDEDDNDYSSGHEREQRDVRGGGSSRRHRPTGHPLRSSEYLSDEDFEYERRYYHHSESRRRDRDYSPEYQRRDYRDSRRRDYYGRRYQHHHRNEDDDVDEPDGGSGGGGGTGEDMYRPSSRSGGSDYLGGGGGRDQMGRRQRLPQQASNMSLLDQHGHPPAAALPPQYHHMYQRGGYDYNQEYYELMRHTNPVLYALWYNDYMSKLARVARPSSTTAGEYGGDRASVHSGQSGHRLVTTGSSTTPPPLHYLHRSETVGSGGQSTTEHASANASHLGVSAGMSGADAYVDESPGLFPTAHVRGAFDSLGRLIVVDAHYPIDGQPASVQVCSVDHSIHDQNFKEFLECCGPFIPNVTHRTTVLQYLKKQSDQASLSSEKLLYSLVFLMLKSNGNPNVSDISELLMESYRQSCEMKKQLREARSGSGSSSIVSGSNPAEETSGCFNGLSSIHSEDNATVQQTNVQSINRQEAAASRLLAVDTFRDLLQQGNKIQALDWAMSNDCWGHALFLSSKLDQRTHQTVMMRFASSLLPSDPLQTLYQLVSGVIPQAATSCGDKKWADWRSHLAMMLSNSGAEMVSGIGLHAESNSPLVDLTTKSILTMADTLASRGRYYAAHFCYILAGVGLGVRDSVSNQPKLLLLGAAPNQLHHTNYKALMITMCYEYAVKQFQPNLHFAALQKYKMMIAWELAEAGKSRSALQYCEMVANEMVSSGCNSGLDRDDAISVAELAERLKMVDESIAMSGPHALPDWLASLHSLIDSMPQDNMQGDDNQSMSAIPSAVPPSTIPTNTQEVNKVEFDAVGSAISRTDGNAAGGSIDQGLPSQVMAGGSNGNADILAPPPMGTPVKLYQPLPMQQTMLQPAFHHGNQMMPSNGYQEAEHSSLKTEPVEAVGLLPAETESDHYASKPSIDYFAASEQQFQTESGGVGDSQQNAPPMPPSQLRMNPVPQPPTSNRPVNQQQGNDKKGVSGGSGSLDGGTAGGSSWLGGFFSKLAPKPKNQMILPDDSDPKIVFDAKLNRWVDKESGGDCGGGLEDIKPPPMIPVQGSFSNGNPPLQTGNAPPPPIQSSGNRYKLQKGKSMRSNYVDLLGGSGTGKPLQQLPQSVFQPAQSENENMASNFSRGEQSGKGNIVMDVPRQPLMFNPNNFST